MTDFQTSQENFWANEFGDQYIDRNKSQKLLASNLSFFANALSRVSEINSCIEFGANIGMNLKAIDLLFPGIKMKAIEINSQAAKILGNLIGQENVLNDSIFNYETTSKYDLTLIKGVLIHINPEMLDQVYEKLYLSARKYILLCEYYSPNPVTIKYRNHDDKLFKRDFAGELIKKYKDLKLIDYGFNYRHDTNFPQDDITWFLLTKEGLKND